MRLRFLRMCRKAVNEVEVTSTTEHLETLKMECGDGTYSIDVVQCFEL